MCCLLLSYHSLEYVRRVAGARTVPVEIGSQYTDENWSQDLMTLSSFIDQYIINEVCGNIVARQSFCLCVCL